LRGASSQDFTQGDGRGSRRIFHASVPSTTASPAVLRGGNFEKKTLANRNVTFMCLNLTQQKEKKNHEIVRELEKEGYRFIKLGGGEGGKKNGRLPPARAANQWEGGNGGKKEKKRAAGQIYITVSKGRKREAR